MIPLCVIAVLIAASFFKHSPEQRHNPAVTQATVQHSCGECLHYSDSAAVQKKLLPIIEEVSTAFIEPNSINKEVSNDAIEFLNRFPRMLIDAVDDPEQMKAINLTSRRYASAMGQLVQTNPTLAYQIAMPAETWSNLPQQLQPLVARQFTEEGVVIAYTGCESGQKHLSLLTGSIGTSLVSTSQDITITDGNFRSRVQGVAFENNSGIIGMEGTEPYALYEGSQPQGGASYSYSTFIFHSLPKTGTLKVLYLIVKYSDQTDFPTTVTNASNSLDQTAVLFDRYSYGQLGIEYDVVEVEIDSPLSADDTTVLRESVEEAFILGFNPDDYDSICRRTSDRGNFAWFNSKDVFLKRDNAPTTLHEIGHNLNLQHANWWKVDAGEPAWSENGVNQLYAEDFDAMSNSPRGDFNAPEKVILGWLSGDEVADDVDAGVYRIYPYDDYVASFDNNGVDGAHYAVKVFKDTTANNGGIRDREYVLSVRNQPEHNNNNNPWFENGIILHWLPWTPEGSSGDYENGAFGTSYLDPHVESDANGELGDWRSRKDAPDRYDGAVLIGQTYLDDDPENRDGDLYITPLRRTDPDGTPRSGDEYIDVKIVKGDQSGNQAPTANWALSDTNVGIGSTLAATVTATDPDDTELGYYWDFGLGTDGISRKLMPLDGSPSQSFIYDNEGTYTLSCVVTDGRGGSVTLIQTITVSDDADEDGLPDSWEDFYFEDLDEGPTDDPDNDGDNNLTEFNNGTDPTEAPDVTAPDAPTGLVATPGSNFATINWNNNAEADFATYSIFRSTVSGSFSTALETLLTDTEYTDYSANNGTEYFYVIRAIDQINNVSEASAEVAVTPDAAFAPTIETGRIHSYDFSSDAPLADDSGSLDLTNSGGAMFGSEGSLSYASFDGIDDFLYFGGFNGNESPINNTDDIDAQTYTVSLYFRTSTWAQSDEVGIVSSAGAQSSPKGYWGLAVDNNANLITPRLLMSARATSASPSDNVSQAVTASAPPLNQWNLITIEVDGANNSIGYWYNDQAYSQVNTLDADFVDIHYFLLGANRGVSAFFQGDIADVRIYDRVGWDDSIQTAAYLSGPSTELATLAAATGLAATSSHTSVDLLWLDNSSDETGFKILRSTSSGSGFSVIHTTAANATSYRDTSLSEATTYYYQVIATNPAGDSAATEIASATTWNAEQSWRDQYFGQIENTGDAADDYDFDRDGVVNLLERAFGTLPNDPSSSETPTSTMVEDDSKDYLSITYRRLTGGTGTTGVDYTVDGLTYTVEYDTDLTDPWSSGTVVQVGSASDNGDGTETVTLRLTVEVSAETKQFIRIKVSSSL
ncbi:MAG: hypothetical protein ACI9ZV_000143 [Candidatus Azotimanducaceae bacterium]|jgi:hypothetical protein